MRKVGDYGSDRGCDKIREPKKIVVLDNKVGYNCKKGVVE